MNNLPATLQNSLTAMDSITTSIDSSIGEMNYLKLAKNGEWLHGSDDDEIADDSVFQVDNGSFMVGYQAWLDGDLEGEEIRLITEPPITKADLPDVGAQWKPLIGFQMTCVEGADKGLQLVYKTTSKGGIKEVNNLMKKIVQHVKEGKDGKTTANIMLDVGSYKHKQYGKIYTPLLEVVEWTEETTASQPVEEPAKVEEPAQVDDDAQVADEPPRRRRRRA